MSFLDDLLDIGSDLISAGSEFLGSNSIGANLAKTALTGFALSQVTKSVNKKNVESAPAQNDRPDPGVRLQVKPDPEHKIPVVYGSAYLGGIISHVEMADNNQTLFAVLTICERTGNLLSTGSASSIGISEIYLDGQQAYFSAGGQLVSYTTDRAGNVDNSLAGLIDIRLYSGNSVTSTTLAGYSGANTQAAYNFIPNWTSTDMMNDLVFAVAKITYDRDKNCTQVPDILFKVTNTMTKAGDCLNDYATNTRYGAGIAAAEIFSA